MKLKDLIPPEAEVFDAMGYPVEYVFAGRKGSDGYVAAVLDVDADSHTIATPSDTLIVLSE